MGEKTASRSPASTIQHSTEVTHAQPSTSGAAAARATADDAIWEPQPSTSRAATARASADDVEESLSGISYSGETSRASSRGTAALVTPCSTLLYASSDRASEVSDSLLGTSHDVCRATNKRRRHHSSMPGAAFGIGRVVTGGRRESSSKAKCGVCDHVETGTDR